MSATQYRPTEAIIDDFIQRGLSEDVGDGDHTSLACIDPMARCQAILKVKDSGIIAGMKIAQRIFAKVDPTMQWEEMIQDGTKVQPGDIAFRVHSNTQAMLQAERLLLNTMQRMSGIATLANRFVQAVQGTSAIILDTRKTTPLVRFYEKWAVNIGGAQNYRYGLFDRIMIKDNHVTACGSHTLAIEQVHQYLKQKNLNLEITVEVRNLSEAKEVLKKGGVHRIMLDNFTIPDLKTSVKAIRSESDIEIEASGGVTLDTVRDIALTGVDFISTGAMTHHAISLDLSLKVC